MLVKGGGLKAGGIFLLMAVVIRVCTCMQCFAYTRLEWSAQPPLSLLLPPLKANLPPLAVKKMLQIIARQLTACLTICTLIQYHPACINYIGV